MQLTEKETTVIKDLQTQERLCVEKKNTVFMKSQPMTRN